MGPVCAPGNVTIPCERSAWNFGAQALYLQTNGSGAGKFGEVEDANSAQVYQQANYNWGWGFKLEGSYHFNTGNDLNLNWYHYNKTTNRTIAVPSGGVFLDDLANQFNETTSAKIEPKWDAVNVEFGQHVDFSDGKNIRLHGGVQYARINTQLSLSSPAGSGSTYVTQDMTYNGFGPRIGVDMSYGWGNGLAMYANAATALLVGSSKFIDTGAGARNTQPLLSGSSTMIVPELEAKLGANYTYVTARGDLSLDLGWMWVNYFNAQQNANAVTTTTQQSNFGLQGPYVGLKWVGSMV